MMDINLILRVLGYLVAVHIVICRIRGKWGSWQRISRPGARWFPEIGGRFAEEHVPSSIIYLILRVFVVP